MRMKWKWMIPKEATLIDKLFLRRARQMVEGAASIQLVCPYCGETQTATVIAVLGGDVVHRCENTYEGQGMRAGCGRRFRGPV